MPSLNPGAQRGPTIGELGEHATIKAITAQVPSEFNGDDAAVLSAAPPNSRTVVTTDMLIESQHFRFDWSTPEEVGRKAVAQNFADIEAMGARPFAALLGISAPPSTPASVVTGVAKGVGKGLEPFAAELVGGDLTAGDQLVISMTAVGSLGGNLAPLTLDNAQPGQNVVASGRLGYSAAGMALLERFGRDVPQEFLTLREAHTSPWIEPHRGMIARATGATAATDNSDGLIADLRTIAARSHLSIDLRSDAIAPDDLLIRAGKLLDIDPWTWVLGGGEDHTILATTFSDPPSGFDLIGNTTENTKHTEVYVDGAPPSKMTKGWVSF